MTIKSILIILVSLFMLGIIIWFLYFSIISVNYGPDLFIDGNCTVIKENSKDATNIVFFGNNVKEAQDYSNYFLNFRPIDKFKDKFNFYFIDGYNPICELYRDIAILCYSQSLVKMASSCPNDHIVVLEGNRDIRFRSSNYLNVMSINTKHPKSVLMHEFGHSFVNLAEEYVPAKIPRFSAGNCVDKCDNFTRKIDGCYEGCSLAEYIRSVENGIMRTLRSEYYGLFNEGIIIEKIENIKKGTGSLGFDPSEGLRGAPTGFAIEDKVTCSDSEYYLIEGNTNFDNFNKSFETGCQGGSGSGAFKVNLLMHNKTRFPIGDFNPVDIFTAREGEEQIEGEIYFSDIEFYLKSPVIENLEFIEITGPDNEILGLIPICENIMGDSNGDGIVDDKDINHIISHISNNRILACKINADVDGSGEINIFDAQGVEILIENEEKNNETLLFDYSSLLNESNKFNKNESEDIINDSNQDNGNSDLKVNESREKGNYDISIGEEEFNDSSMVRGATTNGEDDEFGKGESSINKEKGSKSSYGVAVENNDNYTLGDVNTEKFRNNDTSVDFNDSDDGLNIFNDDEVLFSPTEKYSPLFDNLPSDFYICENDKLSLTFSVYDPDNSTLDIFLSDGDIFRIFPEEVYGLDRKDIELYSDILNKSFIGKHYETIYVSDGLYVDRKDININVIEINNPPVIKNPGVITVDTSKNSFFNYKFLASDIEDGDQDLGNLFLSLEFHKEQPLFMVNDIGEAIWRVSDNHFGVHKIEFCSEDNGISFVDDNNKYCGQNGGPIKVCKNFSITVTNNNKIPIFKEIRPKMNIINLSYNKRVKFEIQLNDSDGTDPDVYWYVDDNLKLYGSGYSSYEFDYTYRCDLGMDRIVSVIVTDGLENNSERWVFANQDCVELTFFKLTATYISELYLPIKKLVMMNINVILLFSNLIVLILVLVYFIRFIYYLYRLDSRK